MQSPGGHDSGDGGLVIAILGSGGREHALGDILKRSSLVSQVYIAPGNAGTHTDFPSDIPSDVSLVIPGSETFLADGVADTYRKRGIPCFGPSKTASKLETSKAFAKRFMTRYGIPTADFATFTSAQEAIDYVSARDARIVVKASGLAAGKGVLLPETKQQAIDEIGGVMVDRRFGDAGKEVVVEDFMEGTECSVMALCDGYSYQILPPAQDYKRLLPGDLGLNTGGMGAVASEDLLQASTMQQVRENVLEKVLKGMRQEGHPFVGLLYMGLMVLTTGQVKVVEFNVRFGDPETQAVLQLIDPDSFVRCLMASVEGRLDCENMTTSGGWATALVAVSEGYPGSYSKGKPITLPSQLGKKSKVFHAGTAKNSSGVLVTSGGRVLALTCTAESMEEALEESYREMKNCQFDGMFTRSDIGSNARALSQVGLTYAGAGVSIENANSFVKELASLVRSTERPGSGAISLESFAARFDLAQAGFREGFDLVACTDGVGTKLKIAQELGQYGSVGIDLVAMSVNDLLVHGAEPLFFLDYIACGFLSKAQSIEILKGIVAGCREAGCALVGGETAEMPGVYAEGEYDLAGFCVGAVQRSKRLPRTVLKGDLVYMLPSTGVHSNGYSLVRRIFPPSQWHGTCAWEPSKTLGQILLTPTQIYVKQVLRALEKDERSHIHALAHITGGGLVENLPRVIPNGLCAKVDGSKWKMPPVFEQLRRHGNLAEEEMLRVFNCGVGFVLVCSDDPGIGSCIGEIVEAIPGENGDVGGKISFVNQDALFGGTQ